jgi:hypothetical protein
VPYIGQDLQVAFPSYTNIDDISGSFDGVTTSFPLTVGGVAPVPAPLGSNQCLISVDGVVQRPDDTGTEGFRLSGGNIIFSSAPSIADDFFGIILAGADYVNVGANFPDGTLGAPSITFDQDNDTGYYRSGSGAVSFASNGVAAGTWSSAGVTAPALIPTGSSVPANGVYLPAANTVGVATNGTGRLFVDASGRILAGTASSSIGGSGSIVLQGSAGPGVVRAAFGGTSPGSTDILGAITFTDSSHTGAAYIYGSRDGGTWTSTTSQPSAITFGTTPNGSGTAFERLRITSAGLVGIGTSTVSTILNIRSNSSDDGILLEKNDGTGVARLFFDGTSSDARLDMFSGGAAKIQLKANGDSHFSGGRLGIGSTTPADKLSVAGSSATDFRALTLRNSNGTTGSTAVLTFEASSGAEGNAATIAAQIKGVRDGAGTAGGLEFWTANSGLSAQRARIDSSGRLLVGTTNVDPAGSNVVGCAIAPDSYISITRNASVAHAINRKTNDGDLIIFSQDGTTEGSISVSGTTVSYNGAHLSRWSQLASGAERIEILRGSVLSNLDEMCEWGEEENEQLNRMKVSDVEGDKNVSGVFQCWDDDDDTYTDDFYCAMTGDFVIRIAEGVTVERGDLLMSAGDGTAKPQDDDIIRSKTIAKVTSTNVSCTYEDGSYCVPCVLMAC